MFSILLLSNQKIHIGLQETLFQNVKDTCTTMKQAIERVSVETDVTTFIQAHATNAPKPPYVEYEPYDPATTTPSSTTVCSLLLFLSCTNNIMCPPPFHSTQTSTSSLALPQTISRPDSPRNQKPAAQEKSMNSIAISKRTHDFFS